MICPICHALEGQPCNETCERLMTLRRVRQMVNAEVAFDLGVQVHVVDGYRTGPSNWDEMAALIDQSAGPKSRQVIERLGLCGHCFQRGVCPECTPTEGVIR